MEHSPTELQERLLDTKDAECARLDAELSKVETSLIQEALRSTSGNCVRAAHLLGISRSRLYRRMNALGIVQSFRWARHALWYVAFILFDGPELIGA
jgi:DNA-binding NtrC family response regulator